ncbi:MAG TPA: hypothetical protein PL131_02090 [Methylotenera sp.]|nr:hypothetical protein [Methylotenera sp.]HPH04637.1 hypothetical protein [Methylotenera sp.]HPN01651.1 hypothetical protein [Methylotenera sp.]
MSIDPKHPVRKIPTSHRSITGAMPTAEKVSQQFESTLERDLMYLLRFDPYVDKFVAQPVTIEYQDNAGSNHTYTPDIIIYHRKDIAPAKKMRTILGEVKYVDDC